VNLIYGKIAEILPERGQRLGKVRVGGATKIISLDLLTDPEPGDKILVCKGIALSKVDDPDP
jgi:hydrogenase maturation factor